MPRFAETIPTSVTVTNNSGQQLRVGFGVIIPAGATSFVIDLSKLRGDALDIRGDTPRERTWQGIAEMSRTTSARGTGLITINSTTPNILPLVTSDFRKADIVNDPDNVSDRPGLPAFENDGQGPAITALTLGVNYIDATFNKGVFNNPVGMGGVNAGIIPLLSDFTFKFNDGAAGATNCVLNTITKTTGAALVGGETTIRFNITVTGTATSADTVTIGAVAGALRDSKYNKNLAGARTVALA